jgi:hypothetical protein
LENGLPYVIIKIIAHGKDIKSVYKEANEKCPNKRPLFTKVPSKETMIF